MVTVRRTGGSPGRAPVVLIGDVVGSRAAPDRRALHEAVVDTLARVEASSSPGTRLAVTVGDEFQGVFMSLGEALVAAFAIRVLLRPAVDTRIGLGRGRIAELDPASGVSDGPGWWAARDALEAVEASAVGSARRARRCAYRSADPDERAPAVNAALQCQDLLVQSMSQGTHEVLKGLVTMRETTQQRVAEALGLTPSALSQHVVRHGLRVLLDSVDELGSLA